ncbi:MAG: EamA family transporter [Acidobacteriia bacterium]|nr:EamA family transporter [Terriglobia bacterium]
MPSQSATDIRAVLRSGPEVEIGASPHPPKSAHSRMPIILGFAAVYLIWGSTYLGIRYAVETIPPLLMMGIRHSLAGALVYAWARRKGTPSPTAQQWGYAVVAGAFLFLAGHGMLAWAEERVPSGLAALLCATLPLWTVLLGRTKGAEHRLGVKAWAGIVLGFAGVALLIGPDSLRQTGNLDLLATAAAMFSAFAWAVGTIYSKSVRLPNSTVLSASMQMLTGGVWLLLAAGVSGEAAQVHVATVTLRSVLALAYLTVMGSIVAFTVFTWLLTVASPSRVSTYAYVNPVVAVFLGWTLAGEAIGVHTIAATVIILTAVALVNTRGRPNPQQNGRAAVAMSAAQPTAAD